LLLAWFSGVHVWVWVGALAVVAIAVGWMGAQIVPRPSGAGSFIFLQSNSVRPTTLPVAASRLIQVIRAGRLPTTMCTRFVLGS
jgi:hypothetical protein